MKTNNGYSNKTKIELTLGELKITMNALHLFRCVAESLHLSNQVKLEEMNLIKIERVRRIFSDRFYKLIENFPIN